MTSAEPPAPASAAAAAGHPATAAPLGSDSAPGDGAAAGYYVRNFEAVLGLVEERYVDLLDEGERGFLDAFRSLAEPAKRLYVRLVSRLGPSFRRDRLHYPEIGDLDAAACELEAAGLLDRGEDEEARTLLSLLRKRELLELAEARTLAERIDERERKLAIFEMLLARAPSHELRCEVHRRIQVLRPLATNRVRTFRLLFFGNLRQDWSELVLERLGLFRYEPYEVRLEHRLFPDRSALDDTLALLDAGARLGELFDAGHQDEALATAVRLRERKEAWHAVARPLADGLFLRVGRHLERRASLDEALRFYRRSAAPPARERQARILARRGQEAAALRLVDEIARAPRDESERRFAWIFGPRLRRRFGLPAHRRWRPPFPSARLRLPRRPDGAVENAVLDALAGERRGGFFSENWLWKSLFGLAFWDVVFAPVPGVFQHPFQTGPLDLFSSFFRARRRELVEARLAELATERHPGPILRRRYREKLGTRNRLVDWSPERRPLLDVALEVLSGELLAAVCDRLTRDPGRFRRGLPDLFVLRDDAPGFELLEVKAPGDQLRAEQEAWIDHLNQNGLPTRVLQVSWAEGG